MPRPNKDKEFKPNYILLTEKAKDYTLVQVLCQDAANPGRFIAALELGTAASIAGEFLLELNPQTLENYITALYKKREGLTNARKFERIENGSNFDYTERYYTLGEALDELDQQIEFLSNVYAEF